MPQNNTVRQGRFSNVLRNLFFLFLILQIAPTIFENTTKQIKQVVYPDTYVGCLEMQGGLYSPDFYVRQINKFLRSENIKGLLLKINCPGGLPGASQAIFAELKKFKKEKPVVALIHDLSASGGYYVAMGSDIILAQPSSMIGSIGARGRLANIKGLLDSYNITIEDIQTGKFKTAHSFLKSRTPEEQTYLQGILDDSYHQFIDDVAKARGLSKEQHETWANGKLFTGNQALSHKLIDGFGTMSDAKEALKKLIVKRGMLFEGRVKLVYPKRLTGLAALFGGEHETGERGSSILSTKIAHFLHSVYNNVLTCNNVTY